MMSAFIDEAMFLADDYAHDAAENGRHNFFPETAALGEKLRAHLEAREAVTRQLAEALKNAYAEHSDDYELRWLEKARAAIQAYDEASK